MLFSFDFLKARKEMDSHLKPLKKRNRVQALGLIDLSGSTKMKLARGDDYGVKKALASVALAKSIVSRFGGITVKELGDGILCRFDNPLKLCLALLAMKISASKLGVRIKGAGTLGMVDMIILKTETIDIYGSIVDKCARILGLCLPNQILLDRAIFDATRTELLNYNNIEVSEPRKKFVKDFGETEVFELTTAELGLQNYLNTPFTIHEEGRLPIASKVYFVRDAQTRVVEMGMGLTTFSKWFSSHRPGEFRDYIQKLLERGVEVNFLMLDPTWNGTKQYLQNLGEPGYLADIKRSMDYLRSERERVLKLTLPGEFKIYWYRDFPSMHVLCVDPDDGINGRMLASPYFYGLSRSESPVLECSRSSNPQLFIKYWKSIVKIIREKSEPVE